MVSEYAIANYFHQARNHGWSLLTRGSLLAGWHACFEGRYRDFNAYLSVADEWVYMQCPLVSLGSKR